ncbi:MAG: deoxyribonuclease IV [Muribaculaceae bacterium]|nr:deoxyribonuclease IV [Muribaculaceae bacterium]
MKYIGAHVSAGSSVAETPLRAEDIGAKAFALFTRNPSRWVAPPLKQRDIELFKERCQALGFTPSVILPHDSFLINLGAPDPEKLSKSREAFLDEMNRCMQLGLTMLNFHPGSHLNLIPVNECLDLIADSINITLDKTEGVKAVIECTAGQGSNLGFNFAQIARIIDGVKDKERVGVCIDSCHAFAAGYDLSTPQGYEATWNEFDSLIGKDYLCGIHLNDAKKGLGSKIDRHEQIGKGTLGSLFFEMLMNDPRINGIPVILETPDESLWKDEIEYLYSLIKNPQ